MRIKREIKVAIFAIIVMVASYWGISFLKGVDIFSPSYRYSVFYEKSESIATSSAVLVKGVKVGTVLAVGLTDDNSAVEVVISVDKKYSVPVDTKAILANQSMLGGKVIILELGDSNSAVEPDGKIMGEIDNSMTEQINSVKDKITTTLDELTTTLSAVNNILNEQSVANINYTLQNVADISYSSSTAMKSLTVKLDTITTNLAVLSGELSESAPALKNTIQNFSVVSDSLRETLPVTISSVNSTLAEVESAIESINSSKGSLGLLLNDRSLYDNLDNSTANLSSLLLDLQQNPSHYVHLSLFGRRDPLQKEKDRQMKREIKESKN